MPRRGVFDPAVAGVEGRDAGCTWSPPVVLDYCSWTNQHAIEVEPNVVLITYMGKITTPGEADSRIIRLRVDDERLTLDH